ACDGTARSFGGIPKGRRRYVQRYERRHQGRNCAPVVHAAQADDCARASLKQPEGAQFILFLGEPSGISKLLIAQDGGPEEFAIFTPVQRLHPHSRVSSAFVGSSPRAQMRGDGWVEELGR